MKTGNLKTLIWRIALFAGISALFSLLLFALYRDQSWKGDAWIAMDTFIEFQVPSAMYSPELKSDLSAIIETIDLEVNVYREGSELQSLNLLAPSKSYIIKGKFLLKAVSEALLLSRLSSGLFDPSFEPLQNAYGFHDGNLRIPDAKELEYLIQNLGWKNIQFNQKESSIFFQKENITLNFSALIKGMVLDELSSYLDARQIDEYVLNFGGSLKIKKKQTTSIKIQDPRKLVPAGETRISSGCISTSSDAQQFFERNGIRYSHIINPLTGLAQNPSQSITVYHPESALKADMLSTTLLLMERSEAISFLSTYYPEAGLLGIDQNGKFSYQMEWQP